MTSNNILPQIHTGGTPEVGDLSAEADFNPAIDICYNTLWRGKPPKEDHAPGEYKWQRKTTTPRQVMDAVAKGKAFTSALGDAIVVSESKKSRGIHRAGSNFASLQLTAVDFDAGTSFDDVLDYSLARNSGAFLYETSSHTPEAPRCRAVFALEHPITDPERATALYRALIHHFDGEQPDASVHDCVRVWYGTRPGNRTYWIGEMLTMSQVDALIAAYEATGGHVVAARPAGPPDNAAVARSVATALRKLDERNMAHGEPEGYEGGARVKLAACPFNPPDDPHEEDASAVVIVQPDGKILATCNHKRCQKRITAEDGSKRGWAMIKEKPVVNRTNGASEAPEVSWDDGFTTEPPAGGDAPVATTKPAGKAKGKGKAKSELATTGESWGPAVKCTDLGNARRLVQAHGASMRYCYPWGAWLTWDGKRWNRDDAGQVVRYAKSAVAGIYKEAGGKATADARTEIGKWAIKSEARDRLGAMVDLARSEPGIAVQPDDLDTDHALLNVANGTLNLRTGILQPHRPTDLITKLTPIVYDAGAACPLWDAFLWRIMDGRQHMIDFLQRAVGYALTGDVSEQCLFYLYGKGANGKSTFLTTILAMLSKDYATQAAPELLTQGDRHPTEIADLRGLRFVATVEVEDGARMAETLVKQMTGGDVLKARFMRGDFFQFSPTHKLFLAANHKLLIKGTDHAMWRRIRMVPFTVTIPEDEKDLRLPEKLRTELPGILAWAVRGCAAWYAQGVNPPADVTSATGDYRSEMDTLGRYLEERIVSGEGMITQAADLYADYCTWHKASGEKEKDLLTQTRFGRDLADRGFAKEQNKSTRRTFYLGIGLLSAPELFQDGAGR